MTIRNNSENLQEKLQRSKEAAAKARLVQQEKEQAYFQSLISGPVWTWYKRGMYFCIGLALLITVETLVEGKAQHVDLNDTYWDEGRIYVEDEWFLPETTHLTGYLDSTFVMGYSPIFGAPKYLGWTTAYKDSKTPLTLTNYYVHKANSIYNYFIYIQIVLLLPVFFYWYKRPNPFFKFGRTLCLFLIFPASIYLLFVTFGIVNLLPFDV